ncbi:MAG: hypothetical protein H6697_10740 [Myxococcales bacterium]|nr:hypothetical protein [Myxococcales bacterium]
MPVPTTIPASDSPGTAEPREAVELLVRILLSPLPEGDPDRGWLAATEICDRHMRYIPDQVLESWMRRLAMEVEIAADLADVVASICGAAAEVLAQAVACGADPTWAAGVLERLSAVYRGRPVRAARTRRMLRRHWRPVVGGAVV